MHLEGFICEHCNGRVDPRTMKCEYCDTQYKREYEDILPPFRVDHYRNPTNRYRAACFIPDYELREYGKEHRLEYAVNDLAHKLAECLIPNMQIDARESIERCGWELQATVEVVKPKYGFDSAFEYANKQVHLW